MQTPFTHVPTIILPAGHFPAPPSTPPTKTFSPKITRPFDETPDSSPTKQAASQSSCRFHREVQIKKEEGAKLGVTLANVRGRVVVHAISASSPALGLLEVGSWLTAVDGNDVTSYWRLNPADYASKLISKSSALTLSLMCVETSCECHARISPPLFAGLLSSSATSYVRRHLDAKVGARGRLQA